MSETGHNYFKSISFWPWVGVAIGVLVITLSAQGLADFFKGLGWPMVGLGITYIFMNLIQSLVVNSMPVAMEAQQAGIDIMEPINAVMAPIMNGLMYILIIGTVLTITGYGIEWYQKKQGKGATEPTPEPKTKEGSKPKTKPKPKPKAAKEKEK
jgi:hypothetical protein